MTETPWRAGGGRATIPREVPVLVVGAGPAGAVAALTLARHGVGCLLVDRRRVLSPLPRATGLSLRSMELARSWGLEEHLLAGAPEIDWTAWMGRVLSEPSSGVEFPAGQPTRAQSALLSPCAPACVAQADLERLLVERLGDHDAVTFATGVAVTDVVADDAGVRAELRDRRAGRAVVVRARHLVAADGVRGGLRRSLGIPVQRWDGLGERIGVQFRAPLWSRLGERRHVVYIVTHQDGHGSFIPAGRGDRWVYAREWDPAVEDIGDYRPSRVTALIRAGAGAPDLPVEIERVVSLTYGAHLAAHFRAGPAFLAGDAAHRMTPRGGMGLNAAVQDGHDLGWKLAWVHHGWAGDALLDSYEAERRPVASHLVARSAAPELARDPADELHIDLGGRIAHVWVPTGGGRRSTLDLLTDGLTLFCGPGGPPRGSCPTEPRPVPPVVERRLPLAAARALGIRPGGALLARPDGRPVAILPPPAHP
ncbi:FAD-dependent monooxygenase [Miltoncostaea oceani]|uniref:FAD-dependent monooxygenase n=1 Tax=Miltoncostaea oceani TaxID=2843216 RepID=UPI002484CCCC|nr:FAD-dependent monooxygenase [Miltoncostaea oceani]